MCKTFYFTHPLAPLSESHLCIWLSCEVDDYVSVWDNQKCLSKFAFSETNLHRYRWYTESICLSVKSVDCELSQRRVRHGTIPSTYFMVAENDLFKLTFSAWVLVISQAISLYFSCLLFWFQRTSFSSLSFFLESHYKRLRKHNKIDQDTRDCGRAQRVTKLTIICFSSWNWSYAAFARAFYHWPSEWAFLLVWNCFNSRYKKWSRRQRVVAVVWPLWCVWWGVKAA